MSESDKNAHLKNTYKLQREDAVKHYDRLVKDGRKKNAESWAWQIEMLDRQIASL